MKRIATSESLAEIGHLRNMLEQAGIRCAIRNEQLSGALGEIPFLECLPELWLVDEHRLVEAETIIAAARRAAPTTGPWQCAHCQGPVGAARRAAPTTGPWQCAHCGETNEGQFAACWQCGREDPLTGGSVCPSEP